MANNATIPEKLYVTIQYRSDATDSLLGFASPYAKNKSFEVRKITQDKWAYGHGIKVNIDDDDNCTVTGEGQGYGTNKKWGPTELFIANCYPKIIMNDPAEGFEIAKSVRRSGWGGSGNVKWRITDPRGFDLEISSENFAQVISCSTLVNGVIQGRCVWGRLGRDNILLPESSEPFIEATKHTQKLNNKISITSIRPGDTVEIFSPNKVATKDQVSVYLGKYFALSISTSQDSYKYGFKQKDKSSYLFRSVSSGLLIFIDNPKVINIVEKADSPLDPMVVANQVNASLTYNASVVLISPTKVKMSDLKTDLVPIQNTITTKWPTTNKSQYYPDFMVIKLDGKYYIPSQRSIRQYESFLIEINVDDLDINTFSIKSTMASATRDLRGVMYSVGRSERTIRTDFNFEDLQLSRMRVTTTDGLTGYVNNIGYY